MDEPMIYQIIQSDCIILLRFLKEKHIFKEYKTKFLNGSSYEEMNSLNNWVDFIFQNHEEYFPYGNDVETNEALIASVTLFSEWKKTPLVFNNDRELESQKWNDLLNEFLEFKHSLSE